MPEITVELAEGRTDAQKIALMRALTDAAVEAIGVDPAVVTVTIHEIPLEHKMKGGVAFSERPEKVAARDALKR